MSEWSIVIKDWMIHDLGLRGYELLIYAIINAYTKGACGGYAGGQERLADMLNTDLNTVCTTISKLKHRGLIYDDPNATWGGGKKKCFKSAERR